MTDKRIPVTRARELRLVRPLAGSMSEADFAVVEVDVPPPGPGEVEVQNLFGSVDPWMRESADPGQAMIPPELVFTVGRPLLGAAVGRVVRSDAPGLASGDLVESMFGFRERFTAPAGSVQRIEHDGLPPELFLGVLGVNGLTAWIGMGFAQVAEGDTVFVSAAAGGVGLVACQLAKRSGARVIGSAGGAEKADFLHGLGVDAVIDYRAQRDLRAALSRVAPAGLDVYFDNVGGRHLAAAIDATRPHARVILCGKLSEYDPADDERPDLSLAIPRSLSIRGFSVRYHLGEMAAFRSELGAAVRAGEIRSHNTIERGIEATPRALARVFTGDKLGKMLVEMSPALPR